MYLEAVLAFNKKNTVEALKILDNLLKIDPDNISALELRALSLKSKGDDANSITAYEKLLKLKPEKEQGPYEYELGMIYNRQKKPEQARPHFNMAIVRGFNVEAAHLFLGLADFAKGDMSGASGHFEQAKKSDNDELRLVSGYYLGLTYYKIGYGAGGTYEIIAAQKLAGAFKGNRAAEDIGKSTEKILEPYQRSKWFANASAMAQYDSNISTLPTGLANTASASGKSTVKLNLGGGAGRMSSPLDDIQWVASYRFGTNKDFNSLTRSFEYVNNTGSLFLNYHSLYQLSGGVKFDGNFNFQNQLADISQPNGGYVYQKYTMTGELGPFARYQLDRRTQLQCDLFLRPQKNYTDDNQSGKSFYTRLGGKRDTDAWFFNPSGNLNYEKNSATGTEFRYTAFGVGFSDVLHVTGEDTVILSLDYLATKYSESIALRSDKNVTARASVSHLMNAHWTALGDFSYTNNSSNVEATFTYNRFQIGGGVSWTL